MLYPFYAQTRTTDILMILFAGGPNYMRLFLPECPVSAQWLDTYNVEIQIVDPNAPLDAQIGDCPIIISAVEKTNILNKHLQKQLLVEHNQKSKTKSQEWSKLTANKKASND